MSIDNGSSDNSSPDNKSPDNSLLTFPCDFPIKAMGLMQADFETAVYSLVHKHCPDLAEGAIKTRLSKDHKYLAITITVKAQNQAHLDAIYQELSNHPLILMVL